MAAVLCLCGCGGEISASAGARGWRYVRGHKPMPGGGTGLPVGDGRRRAPRAAAAVCAGYDATRAMVEENLAALQARLREVDEELGELAAERRQMSDVRAKLVDDIQHVYALLHALAPFCAAKEMAAVAEAESGADSGMDAIEEAVA